MKYRNLIRPVGVLHSVYILAVLLSPFVDAACSSFTPATGILSGAPNDQFYTRSATRTYVVSDVVDCSNPTAGGPSTGSPACNSTQCELAVPEGYLVNIESELNITTSDEQKADILALVKRDASQIRENDLIDFNSTVTVVVSGRTCVQQGSVQWYSFTPTLVCTEGVLDGCTGSDAPESGTAIRACGPRYFTIRDDGIGRPVSGPNVATGSGIEAQSAPPNATIIENPPLDTSSTEEDESSPPNAASALLAHSWTWYIVAFIMICNF